MPLTLTLPALAYRKSINVSLWRPSQGKSYALLGYSMVFLVIGWLDPSIQSIETGCISVDPFLADNINSEKAGLVLGDKDTRT